MENPMTIQSPSNQRPQLYAKSIIFNDNTILNLEQDSIVVFTGANNCGKSQVLRDIEALFRNKFGVHYSGGHYAESMKKTIVAKSLEPFRYGTLDEAFIETNLQKDPSNQGNFWFQDGTSSRSLSMVEILKYWENNNIYPISPFFVGKLDTKERLTVSETKQLYDTSHRIKRNSLHTIYDDNNKEKIISKLFFDAFKYKLFANRRAGASISLHVGNVESLPDRKNLSMEEEKNFYEIIAALPRLDEQGDGMRSFASVLLDNFTTEKTVTIIDEPEAFLHPPQARLIGKMLAKNNPSKRQLFISTHSEDFIQGLLDADNSNVTIIRIDRKDPVNHMSILNSENIKKLWGKPILRYSNILSGLFHEKVIVCESDYDCLFYQAIMDAMYESVGEIAPDVLFTHCGGKDRIKDVVAALKALNVPVVAVCDFDLLNYKRKFEGLVAAFDKNWDTSLDADMTTIYDSMNAKTDAWKTIKTIGKAGFSGNESAAYDKVETICKSMGLFVVPVGEMECFDKTINKEKKEWVYYVLENYDLANELKLEDARKFVKSAIEFVPH